MIRNRTDEIVILCWSHLPNSNKWRWNIYNLSQVRSITTFCRKYLTSIWVCFCSHNKDIPDPGITLKGGLLGMLLLMRVSFYPYIGQSSKMELSRISSLNLCIMNSLYISALGFNRFKDQFHRTWHHVPVDQGRNAELECAVWIGSGEINGWWSCTLATCGSFWKRSLSYYSLWVMLLFYKWYPDT